MTLARCLAYPRAVLWSFFGIRRGAAAREEITTLHPAGLIATGVALAAGLVLLLVSVARAMVAWLGT
ncbi:MAG: DUF2970 domain-containing protein [Luteimonas sp.]|nr:DUF2970 domain-containing protein [Luteimonas sp.]